MNILIPKNVFLRVKDKFVPSFIDSDQAVAASPTLLYKKLFAECYATGKCRLPQKHLAGQCKFSVRTLQYAQTRLVELGYIHVEHTPGECSSYILLLPDRMKKLLSTEDLIDQSAKPSHQVQTPPQNLQGGCATPAHPSYKEDKKKKRSPLSPHSPASRETTPSARTPFPSTTPVMTSKVGGWGDSFSRKKQKGNTSAFQTANALFERLYAAYPRKEAKESARAVWHQLWRRGALPGIELLLSALERFRASTAWNREHGRFVPHLANWIRGRRWEDEAGVPFASSSDAHAAPPASPEKAEQIRICMQRLEEQHRTDPALAAARPLFENFLSRFADGRQKRGPAWGLWSLLYRLGKAPTVAQASSPSDVGVLSFLQNWQRGVHAPA